MDVGFDMTAECSRCGHERRVHCLRRNSTSTAYIGSRCSQCGCDGFSKAKPKRSKPKRDEDVLQVEQLFANGNPAIQSQLFHVEAPDVPTIAPAVPTCEGQLSLTEEL